MPTFRSQNYDKYSDKPVEFQAQVCGVQSVLLGEACTLRGCTQPRTQHSGHARWPFRGDERMHPMVTYRPILILQVSGQLAFSVKSFLHLLEMLVFMFQELTGRLPFLPSPTFVGGSLFYFWAERAGGWS